MKGGGRNGKITGEQCLSLTVSATESKKKKETEGYFGGKNRWAGRGTRSKHHVRKADRGGAWENKAPKKAEKGKYGLPRGY